MTEGAKLYQGGEIMKLNLGSIGCGLSGLPGLLGTAFIVLRLCGVIDWSWLWVLAPLWIPAIIAGVIIVISVLVTEW